MKDYKQVDICGKQKGLQFPMYHNNLIFLKGDLFQFINKSNIDKTQFLTIFRKMGVSREQFNIPMENYSSGQKKKSSISKISL